MNGVSKRDIMRQTGHKSAEMLVCYIRIGEIFTRNAAAWLGPPPGSASDLREKGLLKGFRLPEQPIPFPVYPNQTIAPKPIRRTP
jgi:hypothetical protein